MAIETMAQTNLRFDLSIDLSSRNIKMNTHSHSEQVVRLVEWNVSRVVLLTRFTVLTAKKTVRTRLTTRSTA